MVNTFQYRLIHRYTWRRRNARGKHKMDMLDSRVVRRMFKVSDHYAVVAKIQVRGSGNMTRNIRVRRDR